MKGSTNSDDSPDSKTNLDKKNSSLSWCPEPGNFSQKGKKTCLYCDVTTRNLKPKTNKILFNLNMNTARIRSGLNSSLALSVGKFWLDKSTTTIVALRSLKGCEFFQCTTVPYTRSRDRCSEAIRLSGHAEPSGHMRSIGRSMDWTLKDNMVNGLFLCATLTIRSRVHAPLG